MKNDLENRNDFEPTKGGGNLAPFRPSTRGRPSKFSIEILNDELIITRRWFNFFHLVLLGIVLFMQFFGLFFSDHTTFMFLFNPLTWIVIGLGYYALTAVVNKTVVRVSPARLIVKQGPLPPWKNLQLDPQNVEQLYVKKRVKRSSKTTTTTYEVCLTHPNGQETLVSNLETSEQALFLEQEIERYLGIEDRPVSGAYESLAYDFSQWGEFAERNGLQHTQGKLLERHRVYGNYYGYRVELIPLQPRMAQFTTRTRLTLAVTDRRTRDVAPQEMSPGDVANLFAAPLQLALAGKIKVTDKGQQFIYQQEEVETDGTRLQSILDTLYNLIEAYPHIIPLGGRVVPTLQPIATNRKDPARAVAAQLIQEIAPATELWPEKGEASLLCPQCFVRCAAHKVEISWLTSITYYGCRKCHQSKDFMTIDKVIAVLDNRAGWKPVQQGRTLTVNWLPDQTLFDFDTVEIIRATDEEVERFAVQVGNDTDPVRDPLYRQMECVVGPDCKLSANTLRILQRMFGKVEVKQVDS